MKTYQADVVVIGAGCAGVSSAFYCRRAGLDVLLLEAEPGFGKAVSTCPDGTGSSNINGIFAVGTDYQKSKHIRHTPKEIFTYLMAHANWSVPAWQAAAMAGRSNSVWMDLEALGVQGEEVIAYNWNAPHTWIYLDDTHPRIECLSQAYLRLGGRLLSHTLCQEIVMEDGAVVGVAGVNLSGESFTVSAKAVVLATGEPGSVDHALDGIMPAPPNENRIEKPDPFEMAVRAGAGRMGHTRAAFSLAETPREFGPMHPANIREAYLRQPEFLCVNQEGKRFTSEEVLGCMEDGASAVALQPGGKAFILFGSDTNEYIRRHGWTSWKYRYTNEGPAYEDLEQRFQRARDAGADCFYSASSVEDLARQTGIDPAVLIRTVSVYNENCKKGVDPLFFKDQAFLLPIEGPRFYAIRVFGVFDTLGGVLKSNEKLQILREDGTAIPGLYGAGGAISFLNGNIYTHYTAGSRSMFALVCGQMLGEIIPTMLQAGPA